MKRKLFLMFACLAFVVQAIHAQDLITKRNGEGINSKITEVSVDYVKYKKFELPNGPDYTISATDVFMIKYENGSKDVFETNPATGKVQIRHVVAETAAQPQQQQPQDTGTKAATASDSQATASVQPPQPGNGTFEILGFDGSSVSFRAMIETPFYMASFSSGDRTLRASNIKNTKGNILIGSGATATPGSSLLLGGEAKNLRLPKNTEVTCSFENVPAGFAVKSIALLTDEKAVPMSYDVASKAWIKPKQIGGGGSGQTAATAQAPVEPYSAKSGEYDVVELLENNIVEVEISGNDITQVNLRIRRLVPYSVNVLVPVGSFFVSENPSAQNMVATGEKKVRLTTGGWQNISIPAACANRPKDIPGGNDKFSIQQSPSQAELAQLMPVLNKAGASTPVKQAAVWIITDNADFDDLGILTNSDNTRAIWYETTARAMKICADAGIDITKKRIWNDKETIVSKLSAGELKNWLTNFKSKAESTTTPTGNTGGKTFQVRIKYLNGETIIPNAEIYFFYYYKKTSVLISKTVNTGNGKIVSFDIPLEDDGASSTFNAFFSKEDADKVKQLEGKGIRMFRKPPGENCEYLELQVQKDGTIRNEGCAIQIWSIQ